MSGFADAPLPVDFNDDIRPILSENCFKCHGPDPKARKAKFRLDVEDVAHDALTLDEQGISEVYERITTGDPDDLMPPPDSGKSLSAEQIELLRRWMAQGAPYEKHWSFIPPVRPSVPGVEGSGWTETPVDNFILARLEAKGIAPSPEADKATLLRRVHLDLTGLPPTPEGVADFLADESPDAYETVVDSLLASPHFGERWARHWLDAARYADSNGYSIDSPRSIWPYRDYVVDAFNIGKPFDQFVIEQVAGDLLPDATRAQRIATGFHRNTMINEEGGVDKEEFRMEAVADRVNTTGTVFLGLTMGCARCHDHKYDPLTQRDYFSLFSFLNNDDEITLPLPTPEQQAKLDEYTAEIKEIEQELVTYLQDAGTEAIPAWENALTLEQLRAFTAEEQAALLAAPGARSVEDQNRVLDLFKRNDHHFVTRAKRIEFLKGKNDKFDTTLVVARRKDPRDTFLLIQGDYTRPDEKLLPDVPAVLNDLPADASGTRLDLAQWLVSPENPLLARVTVNRFWQRFFGKGIVETENDFGSQGTLPTHPELLDWLAVEFAENGWQVKPLLKTIVMSAVYRQASGARDDLRDIDPNNIYLARQNRIRLDAEIIRDSALAASGVLDASIGGPTVYPPQPAGVTSLGQRDRGWPVSTGGDRFRRGLYTAFWRGTPYYALTVFDAPNAQEACTRRVRSNTPLQALTLLNDEAFFELAQELGKSLTEDSSASVAERIEHAFVRCLARTPTAAETEILTGLFDEQRDAFERAPGEAAAIAGEESAAADAAWIMVARAMLNLDEFVTRE